MRYTPSLTAILCIIIIAAALAANFLVINPAYDAALANHRTLKAQLNAAQEQQRKPLSDDQKKLAARLQTPANAKLLIDNLTQFRNAAHLGDITYSINPFTAAENGIAKQHIELTVTSATDAPV